MMLPWDIHSSLTSAHLVQVGDVLRRSRDLAARHAKPKLGDTLWAVGCVAYDRSRYALSQAAVDEYRDWMSVGVADHHLLVKIGMVPTRFYRGFPDRPVPDRMLDIHHAEERALQFAFDAAGMAPLGGFFRFEVETTEGGFTKDITFLQVNETGERICEWSIPRFVSAAKTRKTRRSVVKLGPISLEEAGEDSDVEATGAGEGA